MFGMFKNKARRAAAEMKKVEKRDLMQAIVGGMLLVSAADGEISKAEAAQIDAQIRANPSMKHFGPEITETINRFTEALEANFRVGRLQIMREIEDIKNNPADAEEVFVNVLGIAEGDGEIDPKEMKVLVELGQALNQRLKDHGIEA